MCSWFGSRNMNNECKTLSYLTTLLGLEYYGWFMRLSYIDNFIFVRVLCVYLTYIYDSWTMFQVVFSRIHVNVKIGWMDHGSALSFPWILMLTFCALISALCYVKKCVCIPWSSSVWRVANFTALFMYEGADTHRN